MQKLKDNAKVKKFLTRNYAFFIIFGIALFLSLALVIPSRTIFKQIDQRMIDEMVRGAEDGIEEEAHYLIGQSREMAQAQVFDRLLEKNDSAGLISLSTEEARKRELGGILVADEDGQVLSRVSAVSQRGDFISQSTFWGREALEKGESYGIERGAAQPMFIYGAKKLEQEGQILGLIVSVHLLDDDYAHVFVEKYLPEGTKVAFFSKEKGLLGSNFEDIEEKRLLEIYFSPSSEFNEKHGAQINVSLNGEEYHAKNVVFEGGYDTFGNMILFTPYRPGREATLPALIITVLFLLAFFIAFRVDRHIHNSLFLFIFGGTGAIFIFASSFFLLFLVSEKERILISKPPYIIYNSTMEIEPESLTINRDFEHSVAVNILTGGESINVVDVEVNYDPLLARVEEIKTTNSFCQNNFFIEQEIDNDAGSVQVICGLPTPGFNELRGTAFELVFQPIRTGRLLFDFGEDAKILANDGMGTNVLRDTTGASFLIISGGENTMSNKSNIVVFSPTHSNVTKWYKSRNPVFTWNDLDSYKYGYVFDRNPKTEPNGEVFTKDTIASLETKEDGIHYFHLFATAENGDTKISHYPVRIDSTPPIPPSIKASADEVSTGEVVRFEFSSLDELSRLQRTFYVKLRDDGVFFPTGPQLFIAFPKKGKQRITVRVFDRANNYSETQKTIMVR